MSNSEAYRKAVLGCIKEGYFPANQRNALFVLKVMTYAVVIGVSCFVGGYQTAYSHAKDSAKMEFEQKHRTSMVYKE